MGNTNCDFTFGGENTDVPTGDVTVTVSMADVVVKTSINNSGGWNTATVGADVAPRHKMAASDGVRAGWYEKTATGKFKHVT